MGFFLHTYRPKDNVLYHNGDKYSAPTSIRETLNDHRFAYHDIGTDDGTFMLKNIHLKQSESFLAIEECET